MRSRLRMHA